MRHEAKDIPLATYDTRNVAERAVWVRVVRGSTACIDVSEDDLTPILHLSQRLSVRHVAPMTVLDRQGDHLGPIVTLGEWRVCLVNPAVNNCAHEAQPPIAHECSRQETRLT
jgi:hypothetical protein